MAPISPGDEDLVADSDEDEAIADITRRMSRKLPSDNSPK